MADVAFHNEELDLTEAQRVGAEYLYRQIKAGRLGDMPTASGLIQSLRKFGPDDAYLESALLLPTEEYERVAEVYDELRKQKARGQWRPSR